MIAAMTPKMAATARKTTNEPTNTTKRLIPSLANARWIATPPSPPCNLLDQEPQPTRRRRGPRPTPMERWRTLGRTYRTRSQGTDGVTKRGFRRPGSERPPRAGFAAAAVPRRGSASPTTRKPLRVRGSRRVPKPPSEKGSHRAEGLCHGLMGPSRRSDGWDLAHPPELVQVRYAGRATAFVDPVANEVGRMAEPVPRPTSLAGYPTDPVHIPYPPALRSTDVSNQGRCIRLDPGAAGRVTPFARGTRGRPSREDRDGCAPWLLSLAGSPNGLGDDEADGATPPA